MGDNLLLLIREMFTYQNNRVVVRKALNINSGSLNDLALKIRN